MVVVQTEHVRTLDESLIRSAGFVEQPVPLISAEGATETDRLLGEDVLERFLLLDRGGVGDNLSPEERSEVRSFRIPVAGVAVGDKDLLVTVVVQVIKERGPGPPAFVDTKLHATVQPSSGTGTWAKKLIALREHLETSPHVVANRLGQANDAMPRVGVHV